MICVVCELYSVALYRDACARCNDLRAVTVAEFMRAANAVRLMSRYGVQIKSRHRRPPIGRNRLAHAMDRLRKADDECVRLRMCPAERSTKKPPWHYGDERRNT